MSAAFNKFNRFSNNGNIFPFPFDMGKEINLTVRIEKTFYANEENGFFSGLVSVQNVNSTEGDSKTEMFSELKKQRHPREKEIKKGKYKISGVVPNIFIGKVMEIKALPIENSYGKQLEIKEFKDRTLEYNNTAGILTFLSSGKIKGIRHDIAKNIVNMFGDETGNVIENEPDRLLKVPLVGKKRVRLIHESYKEMRSQAKAFDFLGKLGCPVRACYKIITSVNDPETVFKQNPYKIIGIDRSISFQLIDNLALKYGCPKDSPERYLAAARYILMMNEYKGHCYLPYNQFINEFCKFLELTHYSQDNLKSLLDTSNNENDVKIEGQEIIFDGVGVFQKRIRDMEIESASYISARLNESSSEWNAEEIDKFRHKFTDATDEQWRAVKMGLMNGISVITGAAGVGKTYVIKIILDILNTKDEQIHLMAPTGKAAKRIKESTGREAQTIHRFLEYSPKDNEFKKEKDPVRNCTVIVDETSMLDIELFIHLLRGTNGDNTRLIFLGDPNQLPSVGPGNVLSDLIKSTVVPVTLMTQIFRQDADSGIIMSAHGSLSGKMPEPSADLQLLYMNDDKILESVVNIVDEEKKKGNEIKVLAPQYKGEVGVNNLNNVLRDRYNPKGTPIITEIKDGDKVKKKVNNKGVPIPKTDFRVGDKVMQQVNNYDLNVFNGEEGVIKEIIDMTDGKPIKNTDDVLLRDIKSDVEFAQLGSDKKPITVSYPYNSLKELKLSYASTVHKTQGSEYDTVVFVCSRNHRYMLFRQLFYTAITRAAKKLYIVGQPEAVSKAVNDCRELIRYTALDYLVYQSFKMSKMSNNSFKRGNENIQRINQNQNIINGSVSVEDGEFI